MVEEIEAPKGYLLSENPKQNVSLKAGEVATVLFRNNKPGGVAILKQDAMSGLPLEAPSSRSHAWTALLSARSPTM